MNKIDWTKPQRQPLSGLVVIFSNSAWLVIKRSWPILILPLLNSESNSDRKWLFILLGLSLLALLRGLIRYWFFKFYIDGEHFIVNAGWLKKETHIVPLAKIQTVNLEQKFFYRLLKLVKVSVDTAGSDKAEVEIETITKAGAEALQSHLTDRITESREKIVTKRIVLELKDYDLAKLSLSANHFETFLLIFVFGATFLTDLGEIGDRAVSGIGNLLLLADQIFIVLLIIATLIITIVISIARIFFSFYNFRVYEANNGFQIISGLFHVRERLVSHSKIQFVSLKANWVRKLMNMWMLEYFVAGSLHKSKNDKIKVPVTRKELFEKVIDVYHPIPANLGDSVTIHPSYILRRVTISFLASLVITVAFYFFIRYYSMLFFILPAFTFIAASVRQRRFKLYAFDEGLYIRTGFLGDEHTLLLWSKIQFVHLSQTIYQRRKSVATLKFFTAGGNITVPYIDLKTAQALSDFALLKVEFFESRWM